MTLVKIVHFISMMDLDSAYSTMGYIRMNGSCHRKGANKQNRLRANVTSLADRRKGCKCATKWAIIPTILERKAEVEPQERSDKE